MHFVESNLVWLVVLVTGLGLVVPALGMRLEPYIGPLLALLMLIISLTFNAQAVRIVLRRPSRQTVAGDFCRVRLVALLKGAFFVGEFRVGG